jgi:hypothetical protein
LLVAAGPAPPATGAASIVPADALAYVHLSTDPGRPSVPRASALERSLPGLYSLSNSLTARLSTILGGGVHLDYARDIRPWLGKEAAIALLDTESSSAGSLTVLDVRNRIRAQALLQRSGAIASGNYRGIGLQSYQTGTELAFVKHYLVLGQDAGVRAAIDVAARAAGSLADSSSYRAAAAGEPADRVLDAYASTAGVRRLLAGATGALGALGTMISQPALTGTTVSVSPASDGARIRVHGALDPGLVRLGGRPPQFTPTLPGLLPSGSTLMLDVARLNRVAPRVFGALAKIGVASGVAPLMDRLGSALAAQGVNLAKVLSLLDGEAAFGLVAGAPGAGPAPVIVARTADQAAARQILAELEIPLQQLFPAPGSGPGQQAVWNDRQVGGVTVHQLAMQPGLQVDFAVFNGLVAASTSVAAIAAIAHHSHSLSGDAGYRTALGGNPSRVTSLLFLEFSQLLSLAEQTGLTHAARYGAIGPDLQRIHAVGLSSTTGENDTTAELFLQIS